MKQDEQSPDPEQEALRKRLEDIFFKWKRDNGVELNTDQLHSLLYGAIPDTLTEFAAHDRRILDKIRAEMPKRKKPSDKHFKQVPARVVGEDEDFGLIGGYDTKTVRPFNDGYNQALSEFERILTNVYGRDVK